MEMQPWGARGWFWALLWDGRALQTRLLSRPRSPQRSAAGISAGACGNTIAALGPARMPVVGSCPARLVARLSQWPPEAVSSVFYASLLVHRSTFFVLSSPACQKRTMKDRSSTPPLHVHVDENTPVHVHIKKLPKPPAASSQVGACRAGEAKAAEPGEPPPGPASSCFELQRFPKQMHLLSEVSCLVRR